MQAPPGDDGKALSWLTLHQLLHGVALQIFHISLILFAGPVPRNDLIKIDAAFSKYVDKDTITYYEYLNTMQDLRKEVS